MPYLKLLEKGSEKIYRVDSPDAAVGRDPAAAVFVEGDAAKTVSGRHARFFIGDDGRWYVEDTGSKNGTYIGSKRLDRGMRHALAVGDCVGLGLTGTQLLVEEMVGRPFAATMLEAPASPLAQGTVPIRKSEAIRAGLREPAEPREPGDVRMVFRVPHLSQKVVGQGNRVTMGRALECLIRVEGETATSVSRVHSEIIDLNGRPTLRDAGSRHGTYLNGKKIEGATQLKTGDTIMLGPGGPSFTVDEASIVPAGSTPSELAVPMTPNKRISVSRSRVSIESGNDEAEVFQAESPTPPLAREAIKTKPKGQGIGAAIARVSREIIARAPTPRGAANDGPPDRKTNRTHVVLWSGVAVFVVIAAGAAFMAKRHMDRTDAALAAMAAQFSQQSATLDSMRNAAALEVSTVRASLDSATSVAAPKAVLDSLRGVLASADRRANGLQDSLNALTGTTKPAGRAR